MNAITAGIATIILFNGQNLDNWITLAGHWQATDGVMVCSKGPGSIRSVYESEQFVLTFQYQLGTPSLNRVFVHSKMITGGTAITLGPTGLSTSTRPYDANPGLTGPSAGPGITHSDISTKAAEDASFNGDEWFNARISVSDGKILAVSARADGRPISHFELPCDPHARGFLRFESAGVGLRIRDIRVSEPGFVPLFDGKTLDGWEIVRPKDPVNPGWVVEKGVITCRPQMSSWLRTLRTYDNFILRAEYRLPPRGNSGIYVRAPIEGRVSRIGMEFQLLDDAGFKGKVKPAQFTGSIYDGIAPEVSVPCPVDQWNALEIMVDGRRARSTLNGTQLFDALLTDSAKDTNAKLRPLATRRLTGFIGLQDHSAPVRFRNLRIRELPATSQPEK